MYATYFLKEGQNFQKAGNEAKAAENYLKIVSLKTKSYKTQGYLSLATLYFNNGAKVIAAANPIANTDKAKFESEKAKAVADFNQALKVAQKKDDVYYNIGKLMYAYQLSKPEKTYKDWTYDTALKNVRQAIAIDPLPIYIQMEGDILFAQQDYAGALAAYEKVNTSNIASIFVGTCADEYECRSGAKCNARL